MDQNSLTSHKDAKNIYIFFAQHQKITRFITSTKRKAPSQPQEKSQEPNTGKQKLRENYTQGNIYYYFHSRDPPSDAPT